MNDIKKLIESKNTKIERMQEILDKAMSETRSFNEGENNKMEQLKKEVAELEKTIRQAEEVRTLTMGCSSKNVEGNPGGKEEQRALEENEAMIFDSYLRNKLTETRTTEGNMTVSDNGAVIPATIANKIIKTIEDICPIYNMTTKYHVKGDLLFPVDTDSGEDRLEAQYQDEFVEIQSTTTKFESVRLSSYLMGTLTKISLSLVNNSAFNLVDYVIGKVALAFTRKLEKECLLGTDNKMTGVLSCTQSVTAAKSNTITADELIDLQDTIKDVYQTGACWIMHRSTRTMLRKLKDGDGRYLLNRDLNSAFGYSLLGKPVYVSDAMPQPAAGETVIFYGDMSGLYTKMVESMSIEILREKYATQHCIGVIGWAEIDSKIVEPQKMAKLIMFGNKE